MQNQKIKVLMLGWEYPPYISGGLGIATQGLANALGQYADVELVLPDFEDAEIEIIRPKVEVKISVVSGYSSYLPNREGIKITNKVRKKAAALCQTPQSAKLYGDALIDKVGIYTQKAIEKSKLTCFDIIHAHDWMTFPAALQIQKDSGKPLVVHFHSLETDRAGSPHARNPIYKIEQEAIAHADLVVPVSEYTQEMIEQQYIQGATEIKAIHNGADALLPSSELSIAQSEEKNEDVKQQKKDKKRKKKKQRTVLFLGRVTTQKGVETFVRTAKRLVKSHGKLKFVVGGLGDQLENMMQLAENEGLEDKIDFRGFVDRAELPDLLKEVDILFMPSVSEPFGLVAVEAAQFSLPIVMSNQSGVMEILPGVLTAEHWDSKIFARHISMLLKYKKLRKGLGKANRKAVKKYSWKKAALRFVESYEELLAKKK